MNATGSGSGFAAVATYLRGMSPQCSLISLWYLEWIRKPASVCIQTAFTVNIPSLSANNWNNIADVYGAYSYSFLCGILLIWMSIRLYII